MHLQPYDKENIFAKILRGEVTCNKVYEDAEVMAFEDKFRKAPVHVLVVPKGEYASFNDFAKKANPSRVGRFFAAVQHIATNVLGLEADGYKVYTNIGSGGGQVVFHFHVHILGAGGENVRLPAVV